MDIFDVLDFLDIFDIFDFKSSKREAEELEKFLDLKFGIDKKSKVQALKDMICFQIQEEKFDDVFTLIIHLKNILEESDSYDR